MNSIFTRRSIRKYTSEEVSEKNVQELLKAAMYAPSACNEQPWQFIVIRDGNILKKFAETNPQGRMLNEVSLAILVCGDVTKEIADGHFVQDCSAATQNILLMAEENGLGGVWLGVYPREQKMIALRELLGIPDHIIPFSMIPIGYSAEVKERDERFKPERIHYEKW